MRTSVFSLLLILPLTAGVWGRRVEARRGGVGAMFNPTDLVLLLDATDCDWLAQEVVWAQAVLDRLVALGFGPSVRAAMPHVIGRDYADVEFLPLWGMRDELNKLRASCPFLSPVPQETLEETIRQSVTDLNGEVGGGGGLDLVVFVRKDAKAIAKAAAYRSTCLDHTGIGLVAVTAANVDGHPLATHGWSYSVWDPQLADDIVRDLNATGMYDETRFDPKCVGVPTTTPKPTTHAPTTTTTTNFPTSTSTTTPTITTTSDPPTTSNSHCQADVVFAADNSQSLSSDAFSALKSFVMRQFVPKLFPSGQKLFPFVVFDNLFGVSPSFKNVLELLGRFELTFQHSMGSASRLPVALSGLNQTGAFSAADALPVDVVVFIWSPLSDNDLPSAQRYIDRYAANGANRVIIVVGSEQRSNYQKLKNIHLVPFGEAGATLTAIRNAMSCK